MTKTALITGASSGIGRALAEQFAAEGYRLVLVARSIESLLVVQTHLELKFSVRVVVFPLNLTEDDAVARLTGFLVDKKLEIDVLVNNAGFGVYGPFQATSWQAESDLLALQVHMLTGLTKALLPGMLHRGGGGILNVASTAAFQPGPLMAVYYAAKSYVLSFSEALSGELAGTGVTVTALCPGPTNTEFTERAGIGDVRLFAGGKLQASQVAKTGFAAFRRGRTSVIPGTWNRILAYSVKLVPTKVKLAVVKQLHRRKYRSSYTV